MSATPVSVVVASHGRPAHLRRCLIGLNQLIYRPFEVVVVADKDGLAAIADLPFADRVKTQEEITPNISAARNAGVALAEGDVIAFIDDDAVPDPHWLCHLIAAFDDADVMAAGGHVIGRNGISLQWATRGVNALGDEVALGDGQPPPKGYALKLQGTNLALRRSAFDRIGGFDEAYAFYLDDTDVAFRLFRDGLRVVSVPRALVHHGYAPSARRHRNRAPRSLFEIGASMAVYLRKHADPSQIDPALARFRQAQEARLSRFLLSAEIEPRDMRRLRADLHAGISEGKARQIGQTSVPKSARKPFLPLRLDHPPEGTTLAVRWFRKHNALVEAAKLVASGQRAFVLAFAPTIRAHKVQFTDDGVWLQSGGLFGRSDRSKPRVQLWTFSRRVASETRRLENRRDQI